MSLKSHFKRLIPSPILNIYRAVCYKQKKYLYKSCIPKKLSFAKGSYAGKRCFIIGGAPSINQMDLNLLKNDYLMAVNRGFLLAERGIKHVEFYGMSDSNACIEYSDAIPADFAKHYCVFGSIPWKRKDLSLSIMDMYGESNRQKHMSQGFFQFDLTKPVAHSYNVVLQMLQVAVYAGFTDIYIIGVDNDFSGSNMHFYKDSLQEKKNMQVWGFDPTHDNNIAFKQAGEILKENGINLYNAGKGGKLDVIPRVIFEELFK